MRLLRNHKLIAPAALLAAFSIGFAQTGCKQKQRASQKIGDQIDQQASQTDHLSEAFRYLDQMSSLDRQAVFKEVLYQLNSWKPSPSADSVAWQPPKLLETLPAAIKAFPAIANLKVKEFDTADVEYLHQCRMMSQIADWVLARPYRDEIFQPWLETQREKLTAEQYLQLENALKLFDWTVRNIQLDGQAADIESTIANPQSIQPTGGMGYTQLPWQTALFGRGDGLTRGRVFGELASQEKIPTAWLALPGESENGPVKIWLQGIAIGDQIYLVDPRLGLPLPGPNQTGVATLAEAMEDESVLRRAKLPGRFDYAVESNDLKDLIALIDVEPSSMSARIATLQASLTGGQRMEIATSADETASAFSSNPKITSTKMWDVPVLALGFANVLRQELEKQTPFSAQYQITYGLFLMDTPVARSRNLHLKGEFDNSIEKRGALASYMNCRIDDDSLGRLPYDETVQQELDMIRGKMESREQFENRLAQVQVLYKGAKVDGSYMLGVLQYDLDKVDSAINWLEDRTLPLEGIDRWRPSAIYNLARAYEIKGNNEKVDELYRETPTAQEAGNRIRLRLYQKMQGEPESTDDGQDSSQ